MSCLATMLSKHWNRFIACLVVKSQEMYAKFVVDVFCDSLTLIVFLDHFLTVLSVLYSKTHSWGPVFHRSQILFT